MVANDANVMCAVARQGRCPQRHAVGALLTAGAIMFASVVGLAPGAGAAPANGWLRMGNFAPGSPGFDVYIDGKVVSTNVTFEQVTPYAQVTSGPHAITLLAAGAAAGSAPAATASASVTADSAATVAAVSNQSGLAASVYQDDLSAPQAGHAKVRIVHTVGSVPAVDVFVTPPAASGAVPASAQATPETPAFSAIPFGSASPYADLPAGSYDVQLRASGAGNVVLSAHSWPVQAGTVASIVVFTGPQGVTLEVLRDAAGAAAMPAGAMATGAGGMAHRRRAGPTAAIDLLVVALVVAGALGIRFGDAASCRMAPARAANTIGVVRDL